MTATKIYLNRPWLSSFRFDSAFTDERVEQIHKLARNFIASVDFGCPSVNHVKHHFEINPEDYDSLSDAERYKLWVSQWKDIYRELSSLIRLFKKMRKTVYFPSDDSRIKQFRNRIAAKESEISREALSSLAHRQLPRLAETAQALLSGRYMARLAAAEARRRNNPEVKRPSKNETLPFETAYVPIWDPNGNTRGLAVSGA